MADFGGRTRSVALLVVGLFLVVSGAAVGVAGNILVLGQANDAEASSTSLTSRSAGDALLVAQTGNGVAIHAVSEAETGIAGLFTSAAGTAAVAIVGDASGFALDASNMSELTGGGAAIRASGRFNVGVVAESFLAAAVVATASGAAPAIVANAPFRTAIRASGAGGGEVADCTDLFCAGTESTGAIGVIAGTATTDGTGIYAVDQTADQSGFAVVADGDTVLDGSLSVTGGCIGCTELAAARNGTDTVLRQGEVVKLVGLQVASDGATVLVVARASRGDPVIGVVDRGLLRTERPGRSSSAGGGWRDGGTEVTAGGDLRVAMDGMLTLDGPLGDFRAGARLVVGNEAGRLVVSDDEASSPVATFLGRRPDGRAVLLIDLD
jgi:hypothetical protein